MMIPICMNTRLKAAAYFIGVALVNKAKAKARKKESEEKEQRRGV